MNLRNDDEFKELETQRKLGYNRGFEDALDKIKAEIGTVKEKWWSGIHNDYFVKVLDVIAIIDKCRKGKNENS